MSIYIKFIASCWIGVALWCILGITLEQYGISNLWFMVAGYWFYPAFSFLNEKIMGNL